MARSEEHLRAILDHSPNMVFVKDLQGRYVLGNRQLEKIAHRAGADIIGKTDEDIFRARQAAAFRANDLKVLEAGVTLEFEEVAGR